MSLSLVYDRFAVKRDDGMVLPFILHGCSNTFVTRDANSACARHWSCLHAADNKFWRTPKEVVDQMVFNITENECGMYRLRGKYPTVDMFRGFYERLCRDAIPVGDFFKTGGSLVYMELKANRASLPPMESIFEESPCDTEARLDGYLGLKRQCWIGFDHKYAEPYHHNTYKVNRIGIAIGVELNYTLEQYPCLAIK